MSQPEPSTPRRGCLVRALLYLSILPVVFLGLICIPMCGDTGRRDFALRPESPPLYLGTADPNEGDAILTKDQAAFNELLGEGVAGADRYLTTRDAMLADGRAFRVLRRTRIQMVTDGPGAVQVRIMEGEHAGAVGWIAAPWVRRE